LTTYNIYKIYLKIFIGAFTFATSFLFLELLNFKPSLGFNKVLGFFVILFGIIKLIQVRSNIPAFIVSFVIIFYFIGTFIPYTLGYQISSYEAFQEASYVGKSMCLYIVFLFIFFLFLKRSNPIIINPFHNISNSVIFLVISLSILLVLITIYGKGGETIFEGEGYNNSNSDGQTFYEYFSFFLAIIFLFKRTPKTLFILLPIICIYVIKALLYGARVEVVEVILVLIFFWLVRKMKAKSLIPIIFLGYTASELFSVIRVYPNFFDLDLETIKVILFPSDSGPKILISNGGDVFYASNRLISLSDIGLINSDVKFKSFATLFLPFNFLTNSDLASFMVDQYKAGGGGLIFGYFYVWFGILGVFLVALFLSTIVNSFSWRIVPVYSILIFPYIIRWFAYNPVTLFKHGILCSVFVYLVFKIYKIKESVAKSN